MMTLSYFVGNSFHLLSVSCAWFVWRKCSLQPAPTQKKKRKHEHRDSTCQTVTRLKMPLEKKIKPKLSNVNKQKYNSFDLLCSPFHQLF